MLKYKTETRPGLFALYDIRPGNGAGQFLQPRSRHGAVPLWNMDMAVNEHMKCCKHALEIQMCSCNQRCNLTKMCPLIFRKLTIRTQTLTFINISRHILQGDHSPYQKSNSQTFPVVLLTFHRYGLSTVPAPHSGVRHSGGQG